MPQQVVHRLLDHAQSLDFTDAFQGRFLLGIEARLGAVSATGQGDELVQRLHETVGIQFRGTRLTNHEHSSKPASPADSTTMCDKPAALSDRFASVQPHFEVKGNKNSCCTITSYGSRANRVHFP